MLIYFVVVPVPGRGQADSLGGPGRGRGVVVRWVAVSGCGRGRLARRPDPSGRPFRGERALRRLRATTSTLQAPSKRQPLHLAVYLL